MNSKSVAANAKIAGSLAAALTMIAAPVFAGPKPPQPTMDKCYGIALKRMFPPIKSHFSVVYDCGSMG